VKEVEKWLYAKELAEITIINSNILKKRIITKIKILKNKQKDVHNY